MEYWNKFSRPPATALKTIEAGRLKGFSDIKPMWRIQIMTEVFGPCGIGWKYVVAKKWSEIGSDGNIFAFADVELFFKDGEIWSEAIPGNGGSMLVAKEKAGLHSSDEAYKMAITDALGSAMKMIGVAAEVYLGNWDGSKYRNVAPEKLPETLKDKFVMTITTEQSEKLIKLVNELMPGAKKPEYQKASIALGINSLKTTPDQFDILWTQAEKNNFEEVVKILGMDKTG